MEKRDAVIYLYFGILILGAFLVVYLFNLQLTGFAVLQNDQASFDEGVYVNTLYNGSAVVLSANQTNGTYTSKIFDANASALWNNITWQGFGDLVFTVRSCSSADCNNTNFTSANLGNLNLFGQYFQYKVFFSLNNSNNTLYLESVGIGKTSPIVSPPPVASVSLSEPAGTKSSGTGIPLNFTFTGANVTCLYDVHDASDNAVITSNTTVVGCTNTILNLGVGNGNYILNIYVNGSLGFASDSSDFSITLSSKQNKTEEAPIEEQIIETPVQVPTQITELTIQNIESVTLNPLDSHNFNLVVRNTGNVPLSACILSVGGNYASWLSIPDSTQNINAGEEKNYAFSMNVPNDATEGSYAFPVTVQCAEISKNSEFSVQIVKKRVAFNLTAVERTRTNRVVVTYSLDELLNEEQTVQLEFFLYDAANQQVANASENQTLSAGESNEFSTNVPINESLEGNLTLSVNLNSEQYSSSVREPIVLGSPTGFFVFGDNLGTTGNVLAIVILIIGAVVVFFLLKGKKISKKLSNQ